MILILKNLLFTIVFPGTIAVYVPILLTQRQSKGTGPLSVLAFVLFAAGAFIYFWCLWNFAVIGRGTPAPIDAPKKLVVRGLYHYTRNPMYIGVLTVILGWIALYRSISLLIYGTVVFLSFNLFIMFYEEPHLQEIFGSEYDEYRSKVRRWF